MPPKKSFKLGCGGKVSLDRSNPRVVLRPLRAAHSGHSRYRYTSLPPTASLFKQHEFSDIKLKVGDKRYYAHRLILSAASDVFARMLSGDWAEGQCTELELQEDEECAKAFERFLYYFYAGTIVINDSSVIPLYMLADKYNVKALYDECVKVIIGGLKVYVVTGKSVMSHSSRMDGQGVPGTAYPQFSSSSSYSDSSDSDTSEGPAGVRPPSVSSVCVVAPGSQRSAQTNSMGLSSSSSSSKCKPVTHLAASESFPLALVMKMLMYCQNERISDAALYNLEARLAKDILHGNFGIWNDLELSLLVRLLQDTHFYCSEFVLFTAANCWLQYNSTRQEGDIPATVLSCIRYPNMEPHELYDVERHPSVKGCQVATDLVQQSIRYKLFRHCSKAEELENWTGLQFVPRQVKPQ